MQAQPTGPSPARGLRRRWRTRSLRRRVVAVSAAGLAALLVLGVLAFSWALEVILTRAATDAAIGRAGQLAALVEAGEYTPRTVVTDLPSQGAVVQVLDAGGRVLASSDPALSSVPASDRTERAGGQTIRRVLRLGAERDPFVVVTRGLTAADGQDYTLVVASALDVETRTVGTATGLLAAGSLLLGLLLLVGVDRVVARALDPVARISGEVSRITRAGAADRVTVPPTGDEIAALAGTMNAMLDRMSRADAASRQFVSDASHELRSPLATLRSHVETAALVGDGSANVDLDLLHGEILRLERLVDQLLTLAKADDAGLALRRDEVDLDDVVDAEVRRLRGLTGPAGPAVRAHVEPAQVVGDADRLGQVLRNLTENAKRHAVSEVAVRMEVTGPGAGGEEQVLVHVDNDGPPVPPDRRRDVFERFVRLDDARDRDRGGSGLGLAIASTLAAAHDGTLTAGESPSGGSRFTLTLPVAAPAQPPAAVEDDLSR